MTATIPTALPPAHAADDRLPAELTGTARFADDVHRDGELSAVVVRSQDAHGRLVAVDTAEAAALPGVRVVLTAADLPEVPEIPIRSFPTDRMQETRQPVLARDVVRYVGEPVAVVVADDPYLAEDAAEHVRVHVEPLLAVLDPDDGEELCSWATSCGDVDAAFAQAAVVVTGEDLRTSRHTGVPIETRGLVAEWSADGGLDLWGPTKFVDFTRATVAAWFGIAPEGVRVHHVSVGGMFGVRGELYPEDFLVPWAARVTGRPVRWTEDRREHLLAINQAPALRFAYEVAAAADGRLLAFRSAITVDMGAYSRTNGARLPMLAIEELPGPYDWPAFAVTASGRRTTKTPVGSVRAPMALESSWVRERAIDAVARELGIDPLEVRRRSLVPAARMPFVRDYGGDLHPHTYRGGDYARALDELLATADLQALRTERDRRRAAGEAVGIGCALFLAHSGLGGEERVAVRIRDGRVLVRTSASDVGQGLDRMAALVAAEALRVPARDVGVRSGTAHPDVATRGTWSSRATIFVGNAVTAACSALEHRGRERAADVLGCAPGDVAPAPGGFAGPDGATVAWSTLGELTATGEHRDGHPVYGVGGHVALVSVDRELGEVRVERLAVAYDCGRAIDPGAVRAQLAGGAVHGLGITLHERLVHDEAGQPVGASFMEYLLPGAGEVPELRIAVLEHGGAGNPLGVKGAGEAGVIGVGGAVANAVADATGLSLTALPLSWSLLRRHASAGPPGS